MYSFGERSRRNMDGLHPDLIKVLNLAISKTPTDFGILNNGGFRTVEMQQSLYQIGRSGSKGTQKPVTQKDGIEKRSEHQAQDDGFGYAVDTVPFHGGTPVWNWEYVFPVAKAIILAARELGVTLKWGGVWDRTTDQLNPDDLDKEVDAYCARHKGPDFIDGPHFEIIPKPVVKVVKK